MLIFLSAFSLKAKSFSTNHLLVPMGSDFAYKNGELADKWFNNMDNLIKYINSHVSVCRLEFWGGGRVLVVSLSAY